MIEPGSLAFFVAASAALLVVPGPAILFIVARSVEQGTRAGLVSSIGISFGTLAHVSAAALGLSALLASSAVAFQALKYAGAGGRVVTGSWREGIWMLMVKKKKRTARRA